MEPQKLQEFSEILKALGHPIRLKIVEGLIQDPCHVNEIVRGLGLPQSTVSQHLGILRSRGIISPRKEGVRTCYLVTDTRIRAIIKLLGDNPHKNLKMKLQ
ncbi:MAG: metalloregulator ArsR/SmtB family transcription factor [Candidatus Auribacterota bacterium]|nr:metalloregulator ArsR/SmtB family transcription factor [Candidatus Auribacterota bacterium]